MELAYKQKMIDYYEDLLGRFGDDIRSLDWKDEEGMRLRYAVLFSIISLFEKTQNISILDVGSGLGHLYGFLKDQGFIRKYRLDYTGYDISPKLVEASKRKHSEAKFELADILDQGKIDRFDYVFCCGIFNLILADRDRHDRFVKDMILRMYEVAKLGVAISFLSISGIYYVAGREEKELSRYYYFKPEDLVEYIRSITGKFIVRQDYHPGDFTVYMLKEER
ncbi:MAG: class I SAM-dependent methyltransferase [Candidatus Saganbacteria bacterium]|nr:class I SAM-dependent methyltransferase [Candidatus Saganbacteria bacterium]